MSVWIINILRIGVYSIKFLDKIPVSATVNECVKLSRRYGHGASAGFVNAVLRKVENSPDFLPEDKKSDEYLSIKHSFPLWLIKLWREQGYGEELFAAMNAAAPVTVRKNPQTEQVLSEDFEKIEFLRNGYIYHGSNVEKAPEFVSGIITVQDGASQLAVEALDIKDGMDILDLCAAPGGKSSYCAAIAKNTRVTACDIHPHKIELMKQNFARQNLGNITVKLSDATVAAAEFGNKFDRVIADVPCSGLGIIRRRPDIKWAKDASKLQELPEISAQILANASAYVKPGGRILFSTCTINKSENEDTVTAFLQKHTNFRLCTAKTLLPNTDNTDGFFIAVLERTD